MATSRRGAFDRPVIRDPLLWGGVGTGLALVLLSPPAAGSSFLGAALDLAVTFLAGVAMAAVFGGFVRNLVRALGDEGDG